MNSNFNDRGYYKDKILKAFCEDDNVYNIVSVNRNFETKDQICGYFNESGKWCDGAILPYLYIPYTANKAFVFLCFDVSLSQLSNTMQAPRIYINIYAHKSLMKYELCGYNGNRMDILLTLITDILTKQNEYGIGELIPDEPKPYSPIENYFGYSITYSGADFKRRRFN